MLYMIGLGLNDEKDISVKGLEVIKKSDLIYFENYTSKLQCSTKKLEKFYGKKIIKADRDLVEKNNEILENALKKKVAFLVIGDVFGASTHIDLYLRAVKKKIKVEVIYGSSILSAVGITGLSLYKFGKTTSIPFENKNIKTPIETYEINKKNCLHTLFLLDLDPVNNKYLNIKEAVEYLIRNGIYENIYALGCARIGSKDQILKYRQLKDLMRINFGEPPYCLIIPGKLHFIEEEALSLWK